MTAYTPKEGPYIYKTSLPEIEGYAALFNSDVAIGDTELSFCRGAFELELIRKTDIRICLHHDGGETFASVRDGTLRLWEDSRGLAFTAIIPRGRKFRFLAEAVAAGETGVSIQFRSVRESNAPPYRVIKAVDLLHVALTADPAFPTAVWLSNFSLMRNTPPHMKALRRDWLQGQEPPPTRLPFDYRRASGEAP